MRLGLGLAITQPRGRSVSRGAGVPSDASGGIGDLYVDTTDSVTYQKRWVANREGAGDSILFPINLFPSAGDFEFSVRVRRDNLQDGTLRFCSASPINASASLGMGGGIDYHGVALWDSNGVLQHTTNANPTDNKWHTLSGRRIGGTLEVGVDGVYYAGINASIWTPSLTQAQTRCLYTPTTASLSIKCCDLRLTGPGGSIVAPLDEGTGTTITNQAGANGTLTDGTPTNFWYAAWVPLRQGF